MIPLRLQRALILSVALFGTLACALTTQPDAPTVPPDTTDTIGGAPLVALAAPVDGAVYEPDVPVNILARVTNAGEDVERVDVLVDEEVVLSVPLPNPAGAPVFPFTQSWTAAGSGMRTLAVVVYLTDGTASDPVTRTIEIAGDTPVMVDAGGATGGNASAGGGSDSGGSGRGLLSGLFGGGGNAGAAATPVPDNTTDEDVAAPPSNEEEAAPPTPQEEPTSPPEPTEAPSATPNTPTAVTTTGVNVRGGPGTAFNAIGSFAAGTETDLLGVTSDRSWYKLRYYNGEGWVAASLLEVRNADNLPIDDGPPPPTPTLTPVPATEVPTTAPSNRNITFDDIPQGFEPFPPECGQTMSITLRLQNTGSESLGTTSAAIVRDIHVDSGTETETIIPIPDIEAGDEIEVTGGFLTVETNFGTQHRIEIELDANNDITESDEGDNLFSGGLEYTLEQGSC